MYPSSLVQVPDKYKIKFHSWGKCTHEYKWPSPKVTLKYWNCNTSCCNGAVWVDSNVAKVWRRFILENQLGKNSLFSRLWDWVFQYFLKMWTFCYTRSTLGYWTHFYKMGFVWVKWNVWLNVLIKEILRRQTPEISLNRYVIEEKYYQRDRPQTEECARVQEVALACGLVNAIRWH